MNKAIPTLYLVLLASLHNLFAQQNNTFDSLCHICNAAVTDADKVDALNNLASFCYSNKFIRQGDSILTEQLRIAQLAGDNDLILKTYFDNSIPNISSWTSVGDFNRATQFIEKGIEFAKSINNHDYIAIGYTRLAAISRKNGEPEKAVNNANLALAEFQNLNSDSIKAVIYIELADCYQAKKESVIASKNYTNAFDIALASKNYHQESLIYYRLSDLHSKLGDSLLASQYLLRSVAINKKYNYGEELIRDFIGLAKLTEDRYYANRVLSLSDSLHINKYKIWAKIILLAIYTTKDKDSDKAIQYLNSEPDLKEQYMQGGIANYHFELGEIYRWAEKPDSALFYFNAAEEGLLKNYGTGSTGKFYSEVAVCYEMKKDFEKAIYYYEKALANATKVADLASMIDIAGALSNLYAEKSEFKKALENKQLATSLKDSLLKLTKNSEVVLQKVEMEKREHDEQLKEQDIARQNKYNIQYILITLSICVLFILLLVTGMFNVPKAVIKIFNFLFFICLFEFIVLVLDNEVLHYATHGEPLKLWLIKIGLIGILATLQQGMEHRLVKFLESRKLMKARINFSFKKLWKKKKTPPKRTEPIIDPIEENSNLN